jgi:hypothetical protein
MLIVVSEVVSDKPMLFSYKEQVNEINKSRILRGGEGSFKLGPSQAFGSLTTDPQLLPHGSYTDDSVVPARRHRRAEAGLEVFSPLRSTSATKLANEATSLTGQGQFSRAAKQWLTAFEMSPTRLKYLDEAIYCYGLAGHFQRVAELLNTWKIYSPTQSHRFGELAPQMSSFMAERQVGDVQLEGLINIAVAVLLRHQLPVLPELFNLSLDEDEESQWYHYGIPVSGLSVDEIVELDLELVDCLMKANLPINLAGYFIILFEAFGVE